MAKAKEEIVIVAPDQSAEGTSQVNAMYAKFNPVSKRVPLDKIRANYNRNVRVKAGSSAYGVTFSKDAYDIEGMKDAIVSAGCVREPLLVSEKDDGTYEVLRGFRRYTAVVELHSEGKEQATIEGTRELPCLVVSGLSAQEEGIFINDQSAKSFNSVEILLEVWRRLKNRESWYDICVNMAEQIATITGGFAKANQIKTAKTREEKVKLAKAWLNNFVNQFYQGILLYGGPLVQKWLIQAYRADSGLELETDEKAPFKVTSANWPKLYQAIQLDIKNGSVTREDINAGKYGPEFEKVVAKLSAPRETPESTGPEVKTGKEIKALAEMPGRSKPLADAIMATLKNETRDLVSWDAMITALFAKEQVWKDTRTMLPATISETFKLAFDPAISVDEFNKGIATLIEMESATREQAKASAARLLELETQLANREQEIETLTNRVATLTEAAKGHKGKTAKS